MNKEKKIEKINIEIDKLQKELENSYRNGLRYNTKEKEKLDQEKDLKAWLRYQNKIQFYKDLIEKTEIKIKRLKLEQDNLKLDMQEEEYQNKLKTFDNIMLEQMSDLVENLDHILKGESFDAGIADKIYKIYNDNKHGIHKEDYWCYENFGMGVLKVRYSVILENLALMARKDASLRPALKIDKVDQYAELMKKLALSCISVVKNRNKPKTLSEKIAGAFSNGD